MSYVTFTSYTFSSNRLVHALRFKCTEHAGRAKVGSRDKVVISWVVFLVTSLSSSPQFPLLLFTGLEKSAAIRPFATKKSRLASEKILLADSLSD